MNETIAQASQMTSPGQGAHIPSAKAADAKRRLARAGEVAVHLSVLPDRYAALTGSCAHGPQPLRQLVLEHIKQPSVARAREVRGEVQV